MAAAGSRGPKEPPGLRRGSFSLFVSIFLFCLSVSVSRLYLTHISEPLTQTNYFTPEGLLQSPKTFIEHLLYTVPFYT